MAQASLTDADKTLAFNSFNDAFYRVENGAGFYFRDTTGLRPDRSRFWQSAEMMEIAEDAYDRTKLPVYKGMVGELARGFDAVVCGPGYEDWAHWNIFNDDIVWAVIAFVRAYEITGEPAFLAKARDQFEKVWTRGYDTALGGGIWWTTDCNEKNACINCPAIIAACLLQRNSKDKVMGDRARSLWDWTVATLYDNGRVLDHIKKDGTKVDWAFTYNQGTFAGAALLLKESRLPKRIGDPIRQGLAAIQWTRDHLTGARAADIINPEYNPEVEADGDGAGFKSVFARYAGRVVRAAKDPGLSAWLTKNADLAWTNRNGRNLMWGVWNEATPASPPRTLTAWECASAAALAQAAP